jgi:hypothetical protein
VRSDLTTRSPARYSARTTVTGSRSMSVKVFYTTHAVATGGRNGHVGLEISVV